MISLTSIHLLLTYRCTDECDHCFLWSSPKARGTMTLRQIRDVLMQAQALGTVEVVFFEGGEPFLFYPIMVEGLREAADRGFKLGVVTNCYWATSTDDAEHWLRPLADIGVDDLSLSTDLFHGDALMTTEAVNAIEAARRLGLPESTITIEKPGGCSPSEGGDRGEPVSGGQVRFRGRAVDTLLDGMERRPWTEFTECPSEDFANPGRVHVDSFGNVHVCQGLVMGNLWERPLIEIVQSYEPRAHPIIGPLLEGGPAALVGKYALPHEDTYADACHLCYLARDALRSRFPELLAPPTAYGDLEDAC
ncbi:radical SAM protein [Candidatus Bipolaricaulota bacterium]